VLSRERSSVPQATGADQFVGASPDWQSLRPLPLPCCTQAASECEQTLLPSHVAAFCLSTAERIPFCCSYTTSLSVQSSFA
jgi:hypothetical protein